MKYKDGLKQIREMNVAGGIGGVFSYGGGGADIGTHGGAVGNDDWYARGNAMNLWGMPVKKKGKKGKKSKKFPLYRRTFVETLTTESVDNDLILNCILFTKVPDYQQVIQDLLEKYNIPHVIDENCFILEGTDDYLQNILNKIKSIITEDVFNKEDVIALLGEMNIDAPLSKNKIKGGKAKNKTLEDFYKKYDSKGENTITDFENQKFKPALEKGIKIEMEHTKDREIAREIATDHIWEDLEYYTKLDKIEKKK